jgi:nucleotide-binding universal stress UspA family protein
MSIIVIGIDHSDGAKAALRFALEEARLRQATVRAVHVWQFDYLGAPGIMGSLPGGEYEALRSAAEAALDATLQEVANAEGIEVERRVVQGAPAAILVEESRDADLLVVGSRGLGGFRQLLLGSVSQQCAHHAECPVVIVRSKPARN